MAKKGFRGSSMNILLDPVEDKAPAEQAAVIRKDESTSEPKVQGSPAPTTATNDDHGDKHVRFSTLLDPVLAKRLKALAHWKRKTQKDLVHQAINALFAKEGPDTMDNALMFLKESSDGMGDGS